MYRSREDKHVFTYVKECVKAVSPFNVFLVNKSPLPSQRQGLLKCYILSSIVLLEIVQS